MRSPNGFGGISNLGGKRRNPYRARVTIGWNEEGKQLYKTVGYFKNKKEALAALVEYHKDPLRFDNKTILFNEVFEKWSNVKYENASKQLINSYNAAYKHLAPLYDMQFISIRPEHIRTCIKESNKSKSTKNSIKILCNQLYDWAIENDITDKNYAKFVKIDDTSDEESLVRVPFTKDEMNALWDNLGVEYVDTVLILLYTGMRIKELLILKNENINLEERYLKTGVKTTAGKDRIIPIHKDILPLIEKRYDPNKTYLIEPKPNKPMGYTTYRRAKWNDILEKLNMNHLPHDTRHTFISQANRLGLNHTTTKRIIGHSNKNVTEHYIKIDIADIVSFIDEFHY